VSVEEKSTEDLSPYPSTSTISKPKKQTAAPPQTQQQNVTLDDDDEMEDEQQTGEVLKNSPDWLPHNEDFSDESGISSEGTPILINSRKREVLKKERMKRKVPPPAPKT